MAFTTTFVAACLLVAVAEGYVGSFSGAGGFAGAGSFAGAGGFGSAFPQNRGFQRFPQGSFMRPLPLPQPPRLPGFIQAPQLPQPPPLLSFGSTGFNFPNFGFQSFPTAGVPGGSFSGLAVSSTSNDQGGVTVLQTNQDGHTQTFVSNSDGQLLSIPPPPGMTNLMQVTNNLMRLSFNMPEFPEIRMPKFPKSKPIDFNAVPKNSRTYEAKSYGGAVYMSSTNDEPPKIVSTMHSYVNKDGDVKEEFAKYAN